MEPTVPENYFQLRPGYTPGDLDFDPLGLKPEDPEALKEMQTKELQHGRLAHARGRRHDRPGAPDGRHALLSACGDGPAASAMDAPRHQVFLPQKLMGHARSMGRASPPLCFD